MEQKQRVKSFSPSKALKALSADFFDEDVCKRWILTALHPSGAYCPGCGEKIENETMLKNFWEMRRCQCHKCGKWFTATTGTVLHNSQLSMKQVFLLAVFLAIGISDEQIAKACGISSGTVRLWRMRFSMIEKGRLF